MLLGGLIGLDVKLRLSCEVGEKRFASEAFLRRFLPEFRSLLLCVFLGELARLPLGGDPGNDRSELK
ncbi:hypothetical protein M569_15910 [Genlisea aurea]|uniref:Uncharacterized protein n=1 Tax=Genlisea aurea TaxID=192259 RepID=S8DHT0_9LAMI|nr:hypothetical protein M569_15910 [Genlisea aurea]